MHKNMELHKYLLKQAKKLTEDWYSAIDKSTAVGVYASTNEEEIKKLKAQNYSFHENLIQVFIEDEDEFFKSFEDWVNEIASDSGHQSTPTHIILQEFLNVQSQYLSIIESFERENEGIYEKDEIYSWNHIILKAFSKIMTRFVEVHDQLSLRRLRSQQELINELSAPVIKLHQDIGLLPLVGEIDTQRAKYLLENTLMECTKKAINHLYVDLSGVNVIDTMVAMQIFQLIDALKIVGVKTTLSGVRPEIAMTAISLGLNFKDIHITGNLAQALQMK
ncbi:STAS domain-containing protein [Paenisporosarcina sp.]|jgi:rsbT co-antagonist protein RsbR|uniref:STAS domain-containing protein n=1 Tax=Paenisporosarcina sp. TaxID=1932001 RepID=UPI003C78B381